MKRIVILLFGLAVFVGIVAPAVKADAGPQPTDNVVVKTTHSDTKSGKVDAKKIVYNTYALRGCWSFQLDDLDGPPYEQGKACLKAYAKRQNDGDGMNNTNRHIYAWTKLENGFMTADCGPAYKDPAFKSSAVVVWNVLNPLWGPGTTKPQDSNNCDVEWATDVGTNGESIRIQWTAQPDVRGGFDGGERTVSLVFREDGSWSCTVPKNADDNCTRTGPF